MRIEYEVSRADIRRFEKAMQKLGKTPRQLKNPLNRTGRDVRRKLVTGARQVYAYKPGFPVGSVEMVSAGGDAGMQVILKKKGRVRTIQQFRTSTPRSGAKGAVLREGGLKPIIAHGNKGFSNWLDNGSHILVRAGRARYPVEVVYGPSVPKMLEMIWKGEHGPGLQEYTRKKLHDEILKEIRRLGG